MPMWQGAVQIKTEPGVEIKKELGVAAIPVKQEIGATPVKKEPGATPVEKEVKTESGAPAKKLLHSAKKRPLPQHIKKVPLKIQGKGMAFRPAQEDDPDVMVEALPDPICLNVESDDDEADEPEDDGSLIAQVPRPVERSAPSDGVERRLQNVLIYAVGWQQQGCSHSTDMDGYAVQLDERFAIRYKKLLPIQYYINCHKFRCEESGHVGLFDGDVKSFVDHWHFKDWLRNVKLMFDTAEGELGEDEDTIKFVMVCKAGRNRSVAAKVVLNYLFGWLGYDTNDHKGLLSKPSWTRGTKQKCYTCDRCTEQTDIFAQNG